jgi:hypothetical protein
VSLGASGITERMGNALPECRSFGHDRRG